MAETEPTPPAGEPNLQSMSDDELKRTLDIADRLAEGHLRSSEDYRRKVGQVLIEFKRRVKLEGGSWKKWVSKNFFNPNIKKEDKGKHRTAELYMAAAKEGVGSRKTKRIALLHAFDRLTDADEFPEPRANPVAKPGDLWLLGKHRLLCGDSTNAKDVHRLMNGERASLFATDPPYGVDLDAAGWKDDPATVQKLLNEFIVVAKAEAIKLNAAWYCWHASRCQAMLEKAWNDHDAEVHAQIIWAKDRPAKPRSWYLWQHEPCFFGWVPPHEPPQISRLKPRSVWNVRTFLPSERPKHPTPKPTELFAIPMRMHTNPGDICYEPFAGSGSQIIAAEQLHRRCYAMEISPTYVDVCVRGWEGHTGEKAKLSIAANEDGKFFDFNTLTQTWDSPQG